MENLTIPASVLRVLPETAIILLSYGLVRFLSPKDWNFLGRASATGVLNAFISLFVVFLVAELKPYFAMWMINWFLTGFVGGLILEGIMKVIHKVRI